MATEKGKRKYLSVPANDFHNEDYQLANGEVLQIDKVRLESGTSPDTICLLIWDPDGVNEVLYCTHNSLLEENAGIEKTGTAALEKVRLRYENGQASSDYLGGEWKGKLK